MAWRCWYRTPIVTLFTAAIIVSACRLPGWLQRSVREHAVTTYPAPPTRPAVGRQTCPPTNFGHAACRREDSPSRLGARPRKILQSTGFKGGRTDPWRRKGGGGVLPPKAYRQKGAMPQSVHSTSPPARQLRSCKTGAKGQPVALSVSATDGLNAIWGLPILAWKGGKSKRRNVLHGPELQHTGVAVTQLPRSTANDGSAVKAARRAWSPP